MIDEAGSVAIIMPPPFRAVFPVKDELSMRSRASLRARPPPVSDVLASKAELVTVTDVSALCMYIAPPRLPLLFRTKAVLSTEVMAAAVGLLPEGCKALQPPRPDRRARLQPPAAAGDRGTGVAAPRRQRLRAAIASAGRMGHLIKSFGRVVPAAALDAHERAQAMIAEAERQAAAVLGAARAEASEIVASARSRAEAEVLELQLAARREAERVRADAVPGAQALAARMARKIVGRAVELEPHVMAEIAAQALAAARARTGAVVLRVHPDDLATLQAERPQLAARLAKAVELRVVADATVSRHGCVVDSPAGRLDARLETQLAALERAAFASGTGPEG